MWPIGPVIACALGDNRCSCNQIRSLCSTAVTASVWMWWAVTHSEHPVHEYVDLDRRQCLAFNHLTSY